MPRITPRFAAFALALFLLVCAGFAAQVIPGSDANFFSSRASWFINFLSDTWSNPKPASSPSQDLVVTVAAPAIDTSSLSLNATSVAPSRFFTELLTQSSDTARLSPHWVWASNYTAPAFTSLMQPVTTMPAESITAAAALREPNAPAAVNGIWIGAVSSSWSQIANWTAGVIPNGVGDTAEFRPSIQNPNDAFTIQDIASGVTLGRLTLAGTANQGWLVQIGSNGIAFNNGGNGAVISNTNTSVGPHLLHIDTVNGTPITLADNLAVTNTSGSTSIFGSILISAPFAGTGNITYSNVSNNPEVGQIFLQSDTDSLFTGSTTIASGAVFFRLSDPFGYVDNPIYLGSVGGGSATLVSDAPGVHIANPITVVAGSGGTLVLGSLSTSAFDNSYYEGLITLNDNLTITSSQSGNTELFLSNLLHPGEVVITGPGGITKIGPGTVRLFGPTDFTGATVINSGRFIPMSTHSLGATSSITVNNGGTLVLTNIVTDRINDNAELILNAHGVVTPAVLALASEHGATNNTPGIGAVTLLSNSTIDLGTGATVIAFAGSATKSWTGTLSIWNWSGNTITGNGTDQVYFGSNITGLTPLQLSQINFYSDAGLTFIGTGSWGTDLDGEIVPTLVPVPEPATWIGGLLALGAASFARKRSSKSQIPKPKEF